MSCFGQITIIDYDEHHARGHAFNRDESILEGRRRLNLSEESTQLQKPDGDSQLAEALVYPHCVAAASGLSNQQIALDLEIPEVTVGKWRRSFAVQGLDGLRDAARSGRPPKHDASVWRKVQTTACRQPEFQGRWSVRTLAREVGLPHSTVHAILNGSELQLHRMRTFTFSPDPDFEANSSILSPETLIAALEIATSKVLAHVRNRRTSVNVLRFMSEVVRAYPDRDLHVEADNLNIHKNAAARLGLDASCRISIR